MIPTRIVSRTPPQHWEDALITGNGSTGIMMLGHALDDMIIVNHEKLWVVGPDCKPAVPDLSDAWQGLRDLARERRYHDADQQLVTESRRRLSESLGKDNLYKGIRLPYDRTHPAFHLHIETEACGAVERYGRDIHLETGELTVHWCDGRGEWLRRCFVSRTHDVIALEILPPTGATFNGTLRIVEAPGKQQGDIAHVTIRHEHEELYFHTAYGRKLGREDAEGYAALGCVRTEGGSVTAIENQRLDIRDAGRVLLLMRFQYLDNADLVDPPAVRDALAQLPFNYDSLLQPHAAEHGELYRRVTIDLGGDPHRAACSEELIDQARQNGPSPELFEFLHAVGRYALVCGGTGDLPPSLMGIWGNEWTAPWDGRYTFDANLNLAVSAGSQGDLPEIMETYFGFVERSAADWRNNARDLYGCRGVVTDLCQGWRHGVALMLTYPWTGGAAWLASYFYDHYLYTGDRTFLEQRVIPLLKEVAEFYEDFLVHWTDEEDRVVFYPSISPENSPVMVPADQSTNVVPNATSEIAICREALTSLVSACRDLGIEEDNVPRWESLLARLPPYVVNEDGALAEWSFPGLGDRYEHRHSSHLYPVYPSLEISPERTPKLFAAAKRAMAKRVESGLGNKSAHGIMHASFIAARLKDAELAGQLLNEFARLNFLNTSLFTCHFPGPRIFNLDTTFCMPGVLMKLLVHSEPGELELMPALPVDLFPRGTVRGVLARGGIGIEELHWNMSLRQVSVRLLSSQAQTIRFRSGIRLRFLRLVRPGGLEDLGAENGAWCVELPANQAVSLQGHM